LLWRDSQTLSTQILTMLYSEEPGEPQALKYDMLPHHPTHICSLNPNAWPKCFLFFYPYWRNLFLWDKL